MKWLTYIVILIFFNACFILEPSLEETQLEEKQTRYSLLENKLHDSIKKYVKLNLKNNNEVYHSYDFSDVYEHKPIEISEYEALIKKRERLPYLENTYHGTLEEEIAKTDSLIKAKKSYIKANKIHSTYEVGHIFKLSEENKHKVNEIIFFHYPNGKIKDLTVKYTLNLSEKNLAAYESYYYQRPIFYHNTEADFQFYDKVDRQIEKETNQTEFLEQVILIINSIKTNGSIIPEKIIPKVLDKAYPNQTISKATFIKVNNEGLSSDKNTAAVYQIKAEFSKEMKIISFDEWFRIIK